MTRDYIINQYFEWMYGLVCNKKISKRTSYRKLLYCLHNRDFDYILGGGTYKNESDMSYSIPNGYIYLINYKGSSTDVTIPATYTVNGTKYNTVVLSADMDEASVGVFTDNKTITSVSINENVKLVNFSTGTATDYSADNLFSGCTNLTTISSLPNN